MPYIKLTKRSYVADHGAEDAGELNYLLTENCLDYLLVKNKSYQTFNDIIGALECAKLEMYRRMVVPYEDQKIEENGDVYV